MHDFLKFLFYMTIGFQFAFQFVKLLSASKFTRFFNHLIAYNKENEARVERGEEKQIDNVLALKAFILLAFIISYYLEVIAGLLTQNWYVFVLLLLYMLLMTGISKALKNEVATTTGTFIGSLINVLLLGYALVNAYQLHLTFSDVVQRLGF